MLSIEQMREYVQAADNLEEAHRAYNEAGRALDQAQKKWDLIEGRLGGTEVPKPTKGTPTRSGRPAGQITTQELLERTMTVNKKLRGESTISIAKACPGTMSEIVERTGLAKTSVSTLIHRLMKDGIVKKGDTVPMPGYANRTTTVYELAV